MPASRIHPEPHLIGRIGWLRAAVLGANDGILSTASLIVGVASASSARSGVLIAGVAGMVAGAMSMAAGEYVSVSSQADTEAAELERERRELRDYPHAELRELSRLYERRGLEPALARRVAEQLTRHDALGAHMREELGLSEIMAARPVQAAMASAVTFAAGAALPLLTAAAAPLPLIVPAVAAATIVALAGLGAIGARAGGAAMLPAAVRVTVWGGLAMAATAAVGYLFDVAV